jgi:hypothetical protein
MAHSAALNGGVDEYTTVANNANADLPNGYRGIADYNKIDGVTVGDIFDFLSNWFAGKKFVIPGGDGTHGILNVQNIFDFLNAWFAGGC